jgi:hypothetical protein
VRKTFARGACALVAGAVSCLSVTAASAQATEPAGWHVTEVLGTGSANIYAAASPGSGSALAAPAADSAWAIFTRCGWPCTGAPVSLLERWNGHGWSQVPAADLHGLVPGVVAASSATDAWLFQNDPAEGLHWNGSSWAKVAVPQWAFVNSGLGGAYVYAADLGRGGVWVFDQTDYSATRKAAYAARYRDGTWTRSYLPDMPIDVDALAADDIWADGAAPSGKGPTVLMHWTGDSWSTIAIPKQSAGGGAGGIAATAQDSVWVGWYPAKAGATAYLLHWNGSGWAKVSLPSGDTILSIVGDGHGGLWVAGVGPGKKQAQLFLHLHAGRWTVSNVPSAPGEQLGQVDEMALIPGTSSVWGIGHLYGPYQGSDLNRGAIWRYNP